MKAVTPSTVGLMAVAGLLGYLSPLAGGSWAAAAPQDRGYMQDRAYLVDEYSSSETPGIPQVTGKMWRESSHEEKRAYLIGVANTLAVGEALKRRSGTPDPSGKAARLNWSMGQQSIDSAISKIDAWYKANPSRNNLPVLGVVWLAVNRGN